MDSLVVRPQAAAAPHRARGERVRSYALAAALALAATLLTVMLRPHLAPSVFLVFYPAVVAAAWLGGRGAGILVGVVAVAAVDYLFLPPIHSMRLLDPTSALRLGGFVLVAALVGQLTEQMRRARTVAERRTREATELARSLEHARRAVDRDRERMAYLAEVGASLATDLNYQATLERVAALSVPRLGDYCLIDVEEDGRVQRVAAAHHDPARQPLMERARRFPAPRGRSESAISEVLRTGEARLTQVTEALRAGIALNAEHLELMRALDPRWILIVPLRSPERIVGAMSLVRSGPAATAPDELDRTLAQAVADRAAVAIENALLHRDQVQAGAQLEAQAVELEVQAEELQAQTAEMQEITAELERANEALVVQAAEAERARAEAHAANRAKSEFLAAMSHELRTPLNAIGGYVELIEMEIHGPVTEAQREGLRRVRRNQQHLLGLINDVLNFAKLEAGRLSMHLEPVEVAATLRGLHALIEPQLRARRISYACEAADAGMRVVADRERMEQILINLLSNAVKYTQPGGEVRVWAEAEGEGVTIRVADNGPGIPGDRLEAIFEPFVQVTPSPERAREGVGLGLAISRDLARRMEGDLTVVSEPGRGSTFSLRLPRAV